MSREPNPAAIRDRFNAAGVPFTAQRRAIWEALSVRTDHPTADLVFAEVERRMPGLSRATVYRSLETLVELGLVQRLGHPGAAFRYDPKTTRHHHLICEDCGAVVDLESATLDDLNIPRRRLKGFEVRDYSVEFRGRCRACAG